MPRLMRPILLTSLVLVACNRGEEAMRDAPSAADKKAADQAAADKEAADKAAAEAAAAKAEDARKLEEAEAERAYEEVKGALEPLAKLPKKHPKGFASACAAMLEQYDTFMQKGLEGDAQTSWAEGKEARERRMRRECHNRPVEVVVCETQVLKKAPDGTEFGHIMRVCTEKFDQ